MRARALGAAMALAIGVACAVGLTGQANAQNAQVTPIPGMPPVVNPSDIYSQTGSNDMAPQAARDLARVYVPDVASNDVYEIDQSTFAVVSHFRAGRNPQHIVPSWDLRTLWVTNNAEGRTDGSLTPIDPRTGKLGTAIPVNDPYNLYFTPDGKSAIVVAEAHKRLDFRDPHTMALQESLAVPECAGVNHGDFSGDGRYAIFSCEFSNDLVKFDSVNHQVLGYLKLGQHSMPQDVRVGPNGKTFFVADLHEDGVHVIDGDTFKQIGFIHTGVGAHGLMMGHGGTNLYVTNRGSHSIDGSPKSKHGGVSAISFATRKVIAQWPIPGGGNPDMGGISADGRHFWVSGRFDNVVYVFDTTSGKLLKEIPVGNRPHGICVWPQPGQYSLGHTGNLR